MSRSYRDRLWAGPQRQRELALPGCQPEPTPAATRLAHRSPDGRTLYLPRQAAWPSGKPAARSNSARTMLAVQRQREGYLRSREQEHGRDAAIDGGILIERKLGEDHVDVFPYRAESDPAPPLSPHWLPLGHPAQHLALAWSELSQWRVRGPRALPDQRLDHLGVDDRATLRDLPDRSDHLIGVARRRRQWRSPPAGGWRRISYLVIARLPSVPLMPVQRSQNISSASPTNVYAPTVRL